MLLCIYSGRDYLYFYINFKTWYCSNGKLDTTYTFCIMMRFIDWRFIFATKMFSKLISGPWPAITVQHVILHIIYTEIKMALYCGTFNIIVLYVSPKKKCMFIRKQL